MIKNDNSFLNFYEAHFWYISSVLQSYTSILTQTIEIQIFNIYKPAKELLEIPYFYSLSYWIPFKPKSY